MVGGVAVDILGVALGDKPQNPNFDWKLLLLKEEEAEGEDRPSMVWCIGSPKGNISFGWPMKGEGGIERPEGRECKCNCSCSSFCSLCCWVVFPGMGSGELDDDVKSCDGSGAVVVFEERKGFADDVISRFSSSTVIFFFRFSFLY